MFLITLQNCFKISAYLGVFYYMIGNIIPELRVTQRAIQLIACVKSDYIKENGFEPVLKPFIDDVNILAEVIYTDIIFQKNRLCLYRKEFQFWRLECI